LTEEGWKEVVVGRREDVQDRLYAMDSPEQEFDDPTQRKLEKLALRRKKLEETAAKVPENDETRLNRVQQRFEALETQEQEIIEQAPAFVSEETKAVATTFLILDPDGRVHREIRVPRSRRSHDSRHGDPSGAGGAGDKPKPPTSDELTERQLAATFTHQALAVREALLKAPEAKRRILALILHPKVRSEALAIRHETNGTTLHASDEGFESAAFSQMKDRRAKLDPLDTEHIEDVVAYEQLEKVSASKLESLIDLLIVECVTAHMQRRTPLVQRLTAELKINIRDYWKPDATWLSSFQKFQLAHLMVELKGSIHAPAPETKKSALVETLAKLFADAADDKLEDKKLAQRLNAWLPANLRAPVVEGSKARSSRK
jgi:hypothetical protein